MAVRFYLDENVSERMTAVLESYGFNAVSTRTARNKGLSDARQLYYAHVNDRTILTHNIDDFEMLHETLAIWSRHWKVPNLARHSGMLISPDPGKLAVTDAVVAIARLVESMTDVVNRAFVWDPDQGWIEIS